MYQPPHQTQAPQPRPGPAISHPPHPPRPGPAMSQPPHQTQAPQPRSGHRRARFSTTRVRESVMGRLAICICSTLLTLLLIAGVIVFVLWLSLRPHRPRFYVTAFAVQGLNQAAGIQNPIVTFDVTDLNPNRKIRVYYDAMNASVFYHDRQIGAAPVHSPFYQEPKNKTVIHGELAGASLAAGDFAADVGTGRVGFRLDLDTVIRFELSTWDSRHHAMHVSCDVAVGADGSLLPESKDERCSIYFG